MFDGILSISFSIIKKPNYAISACMLGFCLPFLIRSTWQLTVIRAAYSILLKLGTFFDLCQIFETFKQKHIDTNTPLTYVEQKGGVLKDKIKRIRKKAGLSRKQFANRIGASWRSVENWEQGRRIPSGPTIKLIEKEFGGDDGPS